MTSSSFESAAAGLSSVLLEICLHGERVGDCAAVRGYLEDLRTHAPDALRQAFVCGLEEDVAGLPLFSPEPERPLGRLGYLSLVFELEAWASGAAAPFRPWLAPRADAPYTTADAVRDNYVAIKSVTYAERLFSLRA